MLLKHSTFCRHQSRPVIAHIFAPVAVLLLGLLAQPALAGMADRVWDGSANFTFFLTGDTHYGLRLWNENEPGNKTTIDAMNSLPGTALPASLGGVVDTPKGVLIAGDLTDTPEYINFFGFHVLPTWDRDGFTDDYAVDGSGRLRYPVYEGYGNHDIHNTSHSYTLDGIRERNLIRPGLTNLSANGLHYSWDWEGVHFVNLNVYAGESEDAAGSLSFLIDDLAQYVGDSYRPVVLMQHYGMDGFGRTWWTAAEQQAFAAAIGDYNILGVLHAHLHTTDHYTWNGIDFFNGSSAKDGNFLVMRIANGELDVAARIDDRWGYTFSKPIVVPEASSLLLAGIGGACLLWVRRRRGSP